MANRRPVCSKTWVGVRGGCARAPKSTSGAIALAPALRLHGTTPEQHHIAMPNHTETPYPREPQPKNGSARTMARAISGATRCYSCGPQATHKQRVRRMSRMCVVTARRPRILQSQQRAHPLPPAAHRGGTRRRRDEGTTTAQPRAKPSPPPRQAGEGTRTTTPSTEHAHTHHAMRITMKPN